MTTENNPNGLIYCKSCGTLVPKGIHCIYCGFPMNITIPSIKPLERIILTTMKSIGGELTVPKIHESTKISKESIRVHLGGLRRFNLVNKIERGKYTLSKLGEVAINETQ